MSVDFKLANVVARVDDHALDHPELFLRADAPSVSYDEGTGHLTASGPVDFLTYLNALSACKWRRYTGIRTAWLHLEAAGAGEVLITGVAEGAGEPRQLSSYRIGAGQACDQASSDRLGGAPMTLDVEVPLEGEDLVGFTLVPDVGAQLVLVRAYWYAKVEPDAVREVRLALATTTFKKEAYITANIALVEEGLRREGAPIQGNFHMFVVDNGRTLDAAALSDDMVTVLPNPNTGGSGGFARGMMAATEVPGAFTHVLVMDDDVRILAESLIRTFNLLSLAAGRYRDAFINGAMLSLEDPTRQFEDVSYVVNSGAYRRVKDDLHVDRLADVLKNERIDVEVPNAYGAWWYSCIPVSAIEQNGLPMPFFIRCDDVEFGMRNKPVYMTMGGICVWHESFEGRFRASVDCYQYIRNFLAMIAVDDCASEALFVVRIQRSVRQDLRDLDYSAAELLLDGFEDYLKGPEYLQQLDGSALIAQNGARNERLIPVEEMDEDLLRAAGVTAEVLSHASVESHATRFMKVWRSLPYDKHYLPRPMLGSRPGYVVKNGAAVIEGHSSARQTLVFLDPTRKKGAIRHMDRARFRKIRDREHQLMRRYRAEGKQVREAWRQAFPYMTSREFWTKYLGLE